MQCDAVGSYWSTCRTCDVPICYGDNGDNGSRQCGTSHWLPVTGIVRRHCHCNIVVVQFGDCGGRGDEGSRAIQRQRDTYWHTRTEMAGRHDGSSWRPVIFGLKLRLDSDISGCAEACVETTAMRRCWLCPIIAFSCNILHCKISVHFVGRSHIRCGLLHCADKYAFCVVTSATCLCHEHITNSGIGVFRPLVLDCGMTFHLDSGGRDLLWILSDNLWKLIYLATEALSDSFWIYRRYINKSIYLSIYCSSLTILIETTSSTTFIIVGKW